MSAAILERLRETLETSLSRGDAAAALFAALGRWGPRIPSDGRELASFVRGPLMDELRQRIPPRAVATLSSELDGVLATADAPTADHAIPIEVTEPVRWRDETSTKAQRAIAGPVPVLVIAATNALAARLAIALGDEAIDIEVRGDRPGIERALAAAPVLALVDARDPGNVMVVSLVEALVRAAGTTAVVWGSESPYGRNVIETAQARGVELAGVASTEGIGAVFDLVTSRRT